MSQDKNLELLLEIIKLQNQVNSGAITPIKAINTIIMLGNTSELSESAINMFCHQVTEVENGRE